MYKDFKRLIFLLPVALLIFLFSCTTIPVHPTVDNLSVFTVKDDKTILSHYAPVFLIENYKKKYNLIDTPSARINEDREGEIYVDPEKATVYTGMSEFKTFKSTYTNLIYRIHFEKIPGGFIPFHLGKGNNIGLIVIITLNSRNEPILYTSVHTCGAILPLFRHHTCLRIDSLTVGKTEGSLYILKISQAFWSTANHPLTGTKR
jgi:hypothetical protein